MTTGQGQFGADAQRAAPRSALTAPRVTASSAAPPGIGANEEATITAELPAATGRSGPPRGYAPNRHRPGHRDPAPVLLQFTVILLAVALVIVLIGLIVEARRPALLSFLRNTSPVASAPGAPPPVRAPSPTSDITQIATGSSSTTYQVPTSSYQLLVTVGGSACYVEIKSPPSEKGYAYASTLPPSSKATKIAEHGTIGVTLWASATAIAISNGSRTLGTIKNPTVGHTYIFQPATN